MRGFTDMEQVLFTRVADCPNNGRGPCGLAHTCVDYFKDDDGVVRVKKQKEVRDEQQA